MSIISAIEMVGRAEDGPQDLGNLSPKRIFLEQHKEQRSADRARRLGLGGRRVEKGLELLLGLGYPDAVVFDVAGGQGAPGSFWE